VRTIRTPLQLADAVDEDDHPERCQWLAALPETVDEIASAWELELGDPYVPGGQWAWVAPARNRTSDQLALKVGWRHREAEHEAEALRLWDGDGAVRCLATTARPDTTALLLERSVPGVGLGCSASESEQDAVLAGLMRRLWEHEPPDGHPFASLEQMCDGRYSDQVQRARAGGVRRGQQAHRPGIKPSRGASVPRVRSDR
jgi:streptomycin 6-kinase